MDNLPVDLFPLYKPEPPFMPFEGGHGYRGVILQSIRTGKIQCHLCGGMFRSVSKHLYHRHDVDDSSYREMVGLNAGTPLVCEGTSDAIRAAHFALTDAEREEKNGRLRAIGREHRGGAKHPRKVKGRTQYSNSFGTCDLQAKHLFWKERSALGRIPTFNEMSAKLRYLVTSRFGSYEEAMLAWCVSPSDILLKRKNEQGKAVEARRRQDFFPRYSADGLRRSLASFVESNGRMPTWSEARRHGMPHRSVFKRVFGTVKQKEIVSMLGVNASI